MDQSWRGNSSPLSLIFNLILILTHCILMLSKHWAQY